MKSDINEIVKGAYKSEVQKSARKILKIFPNQEKKLSI